MFHAPPERWLTLPDDVFFIVRIALHRVMQIRSIQITSTVVMAATELIQEKLVPYLEQHATDSLNLCYDSAAVAAAAAAAAGMGAAAETRHSAMSALSFVSSSSSPSASSSPPVPPPLTHSASSVSQPISAVSLTSASAKMVHISGAAGWLAASVWSLRWYSALRQTLGFVQRLCSELDQLGQSYYTGRDVLRLQALMEGFQVGARAVEQRAAGRLRSYAERAHGAIMPAHLSQLARTRYILDEETFYHLELHDSWVSGCVASWREWTRWWVAQLQPGVGGGGVAETSVVQTIDALVRELAVAVATSVRQAYGQHRYTAFGALQVDKEVRALRAVFVEAALDHSPYDVFHALMLMSTLLLCDRPQDAKEEMHNTALTPEEKVAVLLMRVDFDRDEVMKLQLK